MVDRNGNGIDDALESRKKGAYASLPAQSADASQMSTWNANRPGANQRYTPGKSDFWTNTNRNLLNFFGDASIFGNAFRGEGQQGGGLGDSVYGSTPSATPLARSGSRTPLKSSPVQEESSLPSFLANLMQSLGIAEDNSIGHVSYDPLRNDANSRGAEYDARLNAMYNQLQGSIRDDGGTIQANYQGAIDQTAERSAQAQQQVQAASDAANSRNMQQLEALGIGEAQAGIVNSGQDLNTQTAAAVQDAAARGQISGDALQQNQQSAGAHNTNLVGAAGLEGNLQRARVQSELSSLLAQYDMEEQQANQQVDLQNASSRNNAFSQAMSLAGALTDNDWMTQRYSDDLAQLQYENSLAANQQTGPDPATLQYLMQLLGEDADPELLFQGYKAFRS